MKVATYPLASATSLMAKRWRKALSAASVATEYGMLISNWPLAPSTVHASIGIPKASRFSLNGRKAGSASPPRMMLHP